MVALINDCEAADHLYGGSSVGALSAEFESLAVDLERDVRLWEDADGELAGAGRVWLRPAGQELDVVLTLHVHPVSRAGDLGDRIVGWAVERARESARERGLRVVLRARVRQEDAYRVALLERYGFVITRYFLTMERLLGGPVEEPWLPEDLTLRPSRGEDDTLAWVAAFNDAWRDHWNGHDTTVEEYRAAWRNPVHRPDLDLVVEAPDDDVAAFCQCGIDDEENRRAGERVGWVYVLGTRRAYRGLGLARALLLAGLRGLQAHGLRTARLRVDAASPTGATQLYSSAGFTTAFTLAAYAREVD